MKLSYASPKRLLCGRMLIIPIISKMIIPKSCSCHEKLVSDSKQKATFPAAPTPKRREPTWPPPPAWSAPSLPRCRAPYPHSGLPHAAQVFRRQTIPTPGVELPVSGSRLALRLKLHHIPRLGQNLSVCLQLSPLNNSLRLHTCGKNLLTAGSFIIGFQQKINR